MRSVPLREQGGLSAAGCGVREPAALGSAWCKKRKGSVGKEEQDVVLRWGGCVHLVDLGSGLCAFRCVLYVTRFPA